MKILKQYLFIMISILLLIFVLYNYNAQNIIFLSFPIRYIQFQVYTEELRKVMDNELEIRYECGYTKKPSSQITLSDREKIVKTIWLHYVYFLPHAELI